MLITNRWTVTAPAPVIATNSTTDLVVGIGSTTWAGANPAPTTGLPGNAAAGNGLMNITANAAYADQIITKVISITMPAALIAGQDNYLRLPFSQFGINGVKQIFGTATLGVIETSPGQNGPNYIGTNGISTAIVNNALFIKIANNNQTLYAGNILNLLVFYSTAP